VPVRQVEISQNTGILFMLFYKNLILINFFHFGG
jgi:hypothetical protein